MTVTLQYGDLDITGFDSANSNTIEFVLLKDIVTGTTINFTNNGWQNTGGGLSTSRGIHTWVASQNITAAKVVINTANSLDLSVESDRIFAFQGTDTNRQFPFDLTYGNLNQSEPIVPSTLTNRINGVDPFNFDNNQYSGQASVTSVSNSNNLSGNNSSFTVIGLPDTQVYSQKYPRIFQSQTQWIVNNQKQLDIRFVSHYGDLVEHYRNRNVFLFGVETFIPDITINAPREWANARSAMAILEQANIPHGIAMGNHGVYDKYYGYNTDYLLGLNGNNPTNHFNVMSQEFPIPL